MMLQKGNKVRIGMMLTSTHDGSTLLIKGQAYIRAYVTYHKKVYRYVGEKQTLNEEGSIFGCKSNVSSLFSPLNHHRHVVFKLVEIRFTHVNQTWTTFLVLIQLSVVKYKLHIPQKKSSQSKLPLANFYLANFKINFFSVTIND